MEKPKNFLANPIMNLEERALGARTQLFMGTV